MVGGVQPFDTVFRSRKHIARHKKIIQLKLVKIAYRLNACNLHLDCDTALGSALCDLTDGLTAKGIRSPNPALDMGEGKLIKKPCEPFVIADGDIVARRCVVIGHALIAVRFGRYDEFPRGFLLIETACRAEHDEFSCARQIVCLDNPLRRHDGTRLREIKGNVHAVIMEAVYIRAAAARSDMRCFLAGERSEDMLEYRLGKDNKADFVTRPGLAVEIPKAQDGLRFVVE